tara:strand:+ start:285 stop:569 length:285 start_codon:yes stop_codon:yes gene_type:complete
MRRISKQSLNNVIKKAGLLVEYMTYFNTFLFPIITSIRLINTMIGTKRDSDLSIPNKFINMILQQLFASERFFLPRFRFPFGVSLLAVIKESNQ